jgi:tetratricopeptide (TPR) repeat protein
MSYSSSSQPRLGVYVLTLLVLVVAGYSVIRYLLDRDNYTRGHQAYQQADCAAAIHQFDRVLNGRRLVNVGGYPALAEQEKADCVPFQTAVAQQEAGHFPAALAGYLDFIKSDSSFVLEDAARSRSRSLFEQVKPEVLVSQETCDNAARFRAEDLIPRPDGFLPAFYMACGRYYDSASNPEGSFVMYRSLLIDYPSDFLAPEAESSLMANELACEKTYSLKQTVLAQRNEFMPSLYFRCGQAYDLQSNGPSSYSMYKALLMEYPDHSLAAQAEAALMANPLACKDSQALRDSVIAQRNEFMPSLYNRCGQTYEKDGAWDNAIRMYERFLAEYPGHALTPEIEAGLARAIVAQAQTASAGEIPAPERSGSTGSGLTEVVVQNDSPERLRIVFSGPESLIEELEPCTTCTTYSLVGPLFCPEQGPIARYTLSPGQYAVVVEAISDTETAPWTGNWTLTGGDEYYSCFVVKRTLR